MIGVLSVLVICNCISPLQHFLKFVDLSRFSIRVRKFCKHWHVFTEVLLITALHLGALSKAIVKCSLEKCVSSLMEEKM